MHILATHEKYKLEADHEYIYLTDSEGVSQDIGWMYGNPVAGIFAWGEKNSLYAIIVGCGVCIAKLKHVGTPEIFPKLLATLEPEQVDFDGVLTEFVAHVNANLENAIYYEATYWQDVGKVRMVADLNSSSAGIYDLDLSSLEITKVFPLEG